MIFNFTQHKTSLDQIKDGIVDVENHEYIQQLLTFDELPTKEEIQKRACLLADYAQKINAEKVMIGGAFYLITRLAKEMNKRGISVCYSFSKRQSVDDVQEDGSVIKRTLYKHEAVIDEFVFSE